MPRRSARTAKLAALASAHRLVGGAQLGDVGVDLGLIESETPHAVPLLIDDDRVQRAPGRGHQGQRAHAAGRAATMGATIAPSE